MPSVYQNNFKHKISINWDVKEKIRTLKKNKVQKITESISNLRSSKNLNHISKTEQKEGCENSLRKYQKKTSLASKLLGSKHAIVSIRDDFESSQNHTPIKKKSNIEVYKERLIK